jgi:uncharacterized membrane protein
MGKKRLSIVFFAVFAILSLSAAAAVIRGTVYDLNLEEAENAVVEINTEPVQKYVAKNSTYTFNVQSGNYIITAKSIVQNEIISSAEESITVQEDGEFVIDIILFPSFEEEDELLAETDFDIDTDIVAEETSAGWIIAVLVALVAFFIILRMRGNEIVLSRKKLDEEEKDEQELRKVFSFIKKEGGRTTQKDIRKAFPQSEAKISLILTELEDKGAIKKIKKGRGNVIILKK